MDIEKKLSDVEFSNRENNASHLAYEREMAFFQSVKDGDIDKARELFKPFNCEEMGKLSDNPLRNLKYHLIITIAFLTRYCIEGGMEMEVAFNLSDIYIRRLDQCISEEELNSLHHEVVEDFVQRMNVVLHEAKSYSKPIKITMDYIYHNLHNRITVEELAEIASLSPSYLGKLFKKEVGINVSEYILKKRVETAENMLRFTDDSCTEISEYLCFSSESHMVKAFKKYTGYTPGKYRNRYFRTR